MALLLNLLKKDSELKCLLMETNIKANTKMENLMEKGNILGQILHAMKVNFLKG